MAESWRIDSVASCQRSGGRRPVRVGAHLAGCAGQLRPERSGVVFQHRHAKRRRISWAASARFSPSSRSRLCRLRLVSAARAHCRRGLALLLVPRRSMRSTPRSIGAALALACTSAFMSLALGSVDVGERALPRRRLSRRFRRRRAGRVSEPHGFDHRDPDAAGRRRHSRDAVFVRPTLQPGLAPCDRGVRAGAWASFRAGWPNVARRGSAARSSPSTSKKGTAAPEALKAAAERPASSPSRRRRKPKPSRARR